MWTNVHKAFCVEAYISTKSLADTRRLFLKKFEFNHRRLDLAPASSCIQKWVEKFRKEGSLTKNRRKKICSVRNEETIRKVADSVRQSPKRSLRQRSQCLGLKRSSLHNILKKNLHLHPYRLQIHQKLKPLDQQRRVTMAKWFKEH